MVSSNSHSFSDNIAEKMDSALTETDRGDVEKYLYKSGNYVALYGLIFFFVSIGQVLASKHILN